MTALQRDDIMAQAKTLRVNGKALAIGDAAPDTPLQIGRAHV